MGESNHLGERWVRRILAAKRMDQLRRDSHDSNHPCSKGQLRDGADGINRRRRIRWCQRRLKGRGEHRRWNELERGGLETPSFKYQLGPLGVPLESLPRG